MLRTRAVCARRLSWWTAGTASTWPAGRPPRWSPWRPPAWRRRRPSGRACTLVPPQAPRRPCWRGMRARRLRQGWRRRARPARRTTSRCRLACSTCAAWSPAPTRALSAHPSSQPLITTLLLCHFGALISPYAVAAGACCAGADAWRAHKIRAGHLRCVLLCSHGPADAQCAASQRTWRGHAK